MDIKGTYKLKKAFSGFNDDFEMQFITREDALKLNPTKKTDDGEVMAMIFARTVVEVTDTNVFIKFDTEFDEIAKKLAKGNDMKPTEGKYFVIKYDIKKLKGNKYAVKSEDGEDEGEIEFSDEGFELAYNFYERV